MNAAPRKISSVLRAPRSTVTTSRGSMPYAFSALRGLFAEVLDLVDVDDDLAAAERAQFA